MDASTILGRSLQLRDAVGGVIKTAKQGLATLALLCVQMFWIVCAWQHHQGVLGTPRSLIDGPELPRHTHVGEGQTYRKCMQNAHNANVLRQSNARPRGVTPGWISLGRCKTWGAGLLSAARLRLGQGLGAGNLGFKAAAWQRDQGTVAAKATSLAASGMNEQE